MATRFKANYRGVGELLKSEFMAAEMVRRAEKAKNRAEEIAPKKSGGFSSSFYVTGSRHGGIKNDRARGVLGSDHPAAIPIELGTNDTKVHRTLRRAMLEAMGGDD